MRENHGGGKVTTMRVGFVGWRGMVGSVLMQRMLEERDFDHIEPVFFSTSQRGRRGAGDRQGDRRRCATRTTPKAFAGLDAIVTCQGGDWTNAMYPQLRDAGWDGYWIDAAQRAADERRRGDHPRSGQPRRDRRALAARRDATTSAATAR